MDDQVNYNKSYTFIFSLFYFCQGFVQGVPFLVWKPYIQEILGTVDIALWLTVYAIGNFPWAIKMIVGIFNDKIGTKKYGRRFPWIISFGTFGAIWWFILAYYVPSDESIYLWLAFIYFMTQLGMAFADTALDGLILDVTPKRKLARVQGYTWTLMFLGYGVGGMLLTLILGMENVYIVHIITGILMILSCILPYRIKEPELKDIAIREFGKELVTFATKKQNWKVYLYTFLAAFQGIMLLDFITYVVLISMNIITVQDTILSITQGGALELLGWSSIFYFASGVGTVIGSLISGKFGDKSRKNTIKWVFFLFIPYCLIVIIPFSLIGEFLIALVFGIIALVLFGAIQNALVVVNQTIRGDLARKYYPNLKSTYFALLVSIINAGQNVGTLIGAALLSFLVLFIANFYIIVFIISTFCAISLAISYFLFRTIDPLDYELEVEIHKESHL
ncbi:MAG: MFS transporter [Candidatus Lokiarchaeota archaeon]|nr:MFS transporter [Candidatus Lokiarchaeota archaeon]MBD3201155.1 MFS transporter [Candidatus Lokiarchaeota archaeon]